MYSSGLSVCYDRLMDIRKRLYNQVCKKYIDIGVVIPPLYPLLFVLAAIDNIDINSSSGTGKNHRYLPLHDISAATGIQKSLAFAVFHAYTGCDTVSSLNSIGKETAWTTWCAFGEVTDAFASLVEGPSEVNENGVHCVERFTVLLYD